MGAWVISPSSLFLFCFFFFVFSLLVEISGFALSSFCLGGFGVFFVMFFDGMLGRPAANPTPTPTRRGEGGVARSALVGGEGGMALNYVALSGIYDFFCFWAATFFCSSCFFCLGPHLGGFVVTFLVLCFVAPPGVGGGYHTDLGIAGRNGKRGSGWGGRHRRGGCFVFLFS